MADEESPLIKALPPATDYLTYLTIVEYNLKPETLGLLHRILQDEVLTINIGWDLVHLLVPYIPHSDQCLQDIARIGNPREVILKVIEGLHLIDFAGEDHDEDETRDHPDDVEEKDDPSVTRLRAIAESSTFPLKTAASQQNSGLSGPSQAVELPPSPPLPVVQFNVLVSMLAILQPRIKTKYPSRFLCTTLQAILASLSTSFSHRDEMILEIIRFTKAIAGVQRPSPPIRQSSGTSTKQSVATPVSAPDPEGSGQQETSSEEGALQTKLLQAFVTHLAEEYLLNLTPYDEIPGMAWCSRMREKLSPERNIPGVKLLGPRFSAEDRLHQRIDTAGPILALAKDLRISDADLLHAATSVEKVNLMESDPDELPNSAEEIPLSRIGSMILYTARCVANVLYGSPAIASGSLRIFPEHLSILQSCLSSPHAEASILGTEAEGLIDAVLAFGLYCIEADAIGEPSHDEEFNEYLQITALLSANCPNANLRGHAQYVTSTILRSHPDDRARLAFIRDTLEHCPFENLKVSAVGWIKGETIEANPPTPIAGVGHEHHEGERSERSIFSTALPLASLAPLLFPSLAAEIITPPTPEAWMTFQASLSFYLASLNFLYLLLSATHLHHTLDIQDIWSNNDIAGSFLQPLRDAKSRFEAELKEGGVLASESSDAVTAEFALLTETIERVSRTAAALNGSA